LMELGAYRTDSPYLFHHRDGSKKLRRDKFFAEIHAKTGIKITAKDLRDYFASSIAMGDESHRPDINTVSELLGHTNLNTTKNYLYSLNERKVEAVSVLDRIENISTGISSETSKKGSGDGLTPCNSWWRRRDLNPGHCGYEPHALTD
jgi:integrase